MMQFYFVRRKCWYVDGLDEELDEEQSLLDPLKQSKCTDLVFRKDDASAVLPDSDIAAGFMADRNVELSVLRTKFKPFVSQDFLDTAGGTMVSRFHIPIEKSYIEAWWRRFEFDFSLP